MDKTRCGWVTDDPIYITYHDEEWGCFDHFFDDRYLFEMLVLEGTQAGLNWLTILKRREYYRQVFDQFEPTIVANYGEDKIKSLLDDPGIIRNRMKVNAAVKNAQAFLRVQAEFGSFHRFLWEFVGKKREINNWNSNDDVPAQTTMSMKLSKELKSRSFTFVGPVICYAFMQAVGLIDDHINDCWIRKGE